MTGPVPRVGGRVLLLDADDRLLLIHERIEDGSTHWLTPGGGVEDGETPAQAAVREAYEETGLQLSLVDDTAVLVTQRLWSWDGVVYDQTDHFFLARVPNGSAIRPTGLTPMEQQNVIGHEWWTLAALHATSETLLPADVGDVVDRILSGPPGRE